VTVPATRLSLTKLYQRIFNKVVYQERFDFSKNLKSCSKFNSDMPESFRRFENLLRLLTTLVLTLSALGLLLIPGRMGTLTAGRSVIFCFLLGAGIYIVGLVNQSSIFIVHRKSAQQIIDTVVSACLGTLSYLYFQAHLSIEGISLAVLVCAQLYLLAFRTYDEGVERNIFVLGFSGLCLSTSLILLLGLFDPRAYENLRSLHIYLGVVFLTGSAAGIAAFFLYPQERSHRRFPSLSLFHG
jgi:hypothetical protein